MKEGMRTSVEAILLVSFIVNDSEYVYSCIQLKVIVAATLLIFNFFLCVCVVFFCGFFFSLLGCGAAVWFQSGMELFCIHARD